jgi:methylmalonyl-CoA/ethylmalonyl-CoA epimerase
VVRRVAHIGIAVRSIDEAARFYEEQLGLKVTRRESVPSQKVTVGFLPVGDTCIELVQPDSPDAPIAKFLDTRGPGLHHICFEVEDIDSTHSDLTAAGTRLIDKAPRPGAHGTRVAFVHPESTGGVLVELSQPDSPAPEA